jgi:signal transduction histidine kinase
VDSALVVLEALEDAAAIVSPSGVVEAANPSWRDADVVGVTVAVDERIRAPRVLDLLARGGSVEHARSGGDQARAIDVRVTPAGDRRLVVLRDRTELRRAEDRLHASNSRLRSIIAGAPIVLLGLDPDGMFTVVEGIGGSGLGATPELLIGRSIYEAYAHVTPFIDAFQRARDGAEIITRVEVGLLTFEVHFSATRDDQGRVQRITGVATDISERTRIERMKNEFVSVVSHELRTPLTSIRGSLGLLEGGVVGALPEQAQQLVTIARNNADRLIRLINDILDLDKLEAGRLEFRAEPVKAASLLRDCAEALTGMARDAGVDVEIEAEPLEVTGDRERLLQVLVNFASNALKFSPDGGVVTLAARRDDDRARFEVRDQGPGIPLEQRERLFKKFEQLQSPLVRKSGGSGLGLAISKAIVDAHGGRIGVQSEAGSGSTFFFTMPRKGTADEVTPRSRASEFRGRTVEIDVGQLRIPSRRPTADRLDELLGLIADLESDDTPRLIDAHAEASVLQATLDPDVDDEVVARVRAVVRALESAGLRASGDPADLATAVRELSDAVSLLRSE